MAVKISDGAGRAVRPASVAALGRRGIEYGADSFPVRDLHGEKVGEMLPTDQRGSPVRWRVG
jgi:hypothetical protein